MCGRGRQDKGTEGKDDRRPYYSGFMSNQIWRNRSPAAPSNGDGGRRREGRGSSESMDLRRRDARRGQVVGWRCKREIFKGRNDKYSRAAARKPRARPAWRGSSLASLALAALAVGRAFASVRRRQRHGAARDDQACFAQFDLRGSVRPAPARNELRGLSLNRWDPLASIESAGSGRRGWAI